MKSLQEQIHGTDFWNSIDENKKKMITRADGFLDFNDCIRLYDSNNKHTLSVLRCYDGGFDITLPDGKVQWADCNGEMIDFWEFLAHQFGVELIDNKEK